jgi:outer membrane protein OmpA-like peptidoglycan-associated protein
VLAHLKRGDVLMRMGRMLDALADYDAAAGLNQKNALELEYRRVAAKKAATHRDETLVAVASTGVMIFFDYGMSDITPEAARVLELASKVLLAGHATSAQITGHVDAAEFKESPDIAMGRAYAVRSTLVRSGVAGASLTAVAGSQSEMLVPTQDREPQNRRVAVKFRK